MAITFSNCPRCGSDEIAHGYSAPPLRFDVQCYADGCGSITVADTEQECADLWNGGLWQFRAIDWDEMGDPCEFEENRAASKGGQ